jgi:hypothetical protein
VNRLKTLLFFILEEHFIIAQFLDIKEISRQHKPTSAARFSFDYLLVTF